MSYENLLQCHSHRIILLFSGGRGAALLAAMRNKNKKPGDQEVVTSDRGVDTSMQSAASSVPTGRGALLASAMSSRSSVASSVAPAQGRQALLERLKIKKATEGGAASSIVSATKPPIGRAALVSISCLHTGTRYVS